MDENLKAIYKILKILKSSMDLEEFDINTINYESLKLSEPRWARIMKMLVDNEYITGVTISNTFEQSYPKVHIIRPEITLKGIEYLQDNSLMKCISNTAKGIVELIP